jgi:hypothetical protein
MPWQSCSAALPQHYVGYLLGLHQGDSNFSVYLCSSGLNSQHDLIVAKEYLWW